jgi:hypothetical protein
MSKQSSREDQFPGTGQAQTVDPTGVLDQHFTMVTEQL